MGLFSWFRRDKKKKPTEQELESQYEATLDPTAAAPVAPPPPPVVAPPVVAAPKPTAVAPAPVAPVAPVAPPKPAPTPVATAPVAPPKPALAVPAPVAPPKPSAPVAPPKPTPVAAAPVVAPKPAPVVPAPVGAPKPPPVVPAPAGAPKPAPVVPAPVGAPKPAPVVPAPVVPPKPAPVAPALAPTPDPVPQPIAAPPSPAPAPDLRPDSRVSEASARTVPLTKPALLAQPEAPAKPVAEKPKGFFGKLKSAMSKTRMILSRKVAGIIGLGQKIDEDLLDKLEEALIEADLGIDTTSMLMDDIRRAWKGGDIVSGDDIFPFLKADLKHRLGAGSTTIRTATSGPTVILVVGVNGAGKTTSIAKMARIHVLEGRRVLLAAGDTFRAAAVEQLVTWSSRIGCDVESGKSGQDPAAVAYAACERAVRERHDILIIDTAGRLHTQKNLMDELAKIHKVIGKVIPQAPHETIMVLDATTGQNAINQAKMFRAVADVSGIFLAKLDGTAKGGAVLSIDRQVGIPVKYVGLGESFEDVQRFNAHAFVDALFDETLAA